MRTVHLAIPLVAISVLTACSEPFEPTVTGPSNARRDIGTYIGSGTAVHDSTLAVSALEPTDGSRGSGYGGSGH